MSSDANEPAAIDVGSDEDWEHDEETGGLVRMIRADDGVEIGLWRAGRRAGTEIEFEPAAHETFVVLTGTGELRTGDGDRIELRPGVIVSLPPGSRTTWVVDDEFREFWVYS